MLRRSEKTREVRGHEKKHQEKVVRGREMWCSRPVGQETTSRQQASRSFSDACSSWSSKLREKRFSVQYGRLFFFCQESLFVNRCSKRSKQIANQKPSPRCLPCSSVVLVG